MEFNPIASSSAGNLYTVSSGGTRLMLECGLRWRDLQKRLGYDVTSFDGCLVTHEHSDHSRSMRELISRGVKVYTSAGTANALDLGGQCEILRPKQRYRIGCIDVMPFSVFHDAAEPLGFLLRDKDDLLLFATDTCSIPVLVDGVTIAAIECNHAVDLFAPDAADWEKRARRSHMSIDSFCDYLDKLDRSRMKQIYLLHMSDRHAREDDFVERIKKRYGLPVSACPK